VPPIRDFAALGFAHIAFAVEAVSKLATSTITRCGL
jgi:hypothetical protein